MEAWGYDRAPTHFAGPTELQVVTGSADLKGVAGTHVRSVKEFIVHPKYRHAVKTGYDIALLKLAVPVSGPYARLSGKVGHDPQTKPPGAMTMLAGWGDQKFRAPVKRSKLSDGGAFAAGSEMLREVDLPTVGETACRNRFPNATIGHQQICAGHEEGRKDSCQGDSGGPLVAFDGKGCPYQVGIVSLGGRMRGQESIRCLHARLGLSTLDPATRPGCRPAQGRCRPTSAQERRSSFRSGQSRCRT